MRVYNLTVRDLHFRKTVLPPNGGSRNFPELDEFIPDSDRDLAEAKVIAFGSLPKWWLDRKKAEAAAKEESAPKTSDTPVVQVELEKPQKLPSKNKRR